MVTSPSGLIILATGPSGRRRRELSLNQPSLVDSVRTYRDSPERRTSAINWLPRFMVMARALEARCRSPVDSIFWPPVSMRMEKCNEPDIDFSRAALSMLATLVGVGATVVGAAV